MNKYAQSLAMKKIIWTTCSLMVAFFCVSGCGAVLKKTSGQEPYKELLPEEQLIEPEPADTDDSGMDKPSISLEEENSYYLYLEAQAQKKQGDLAKAILYLELALHNDPESLYLKQEMAILYLQNNQAEKALAVVEDILNVDPNHVDALIMAATIKKALNKDEDVKAMYEKALQSDPTRKSTYQILGKMYLDDGDLDSAYRTYEQMIQNFSNDYTGYYYLGMIYEVKGNLDKAEEAFLKTLELSPTLIEPRLELIKIYQNTRQNKKLIAVYEEIREQYPDNIPVAIELSILYHQNSRVEAAGRIFEELGMQSLEDPNVIKTVIQNLILQKRDQDAVILLGGMLKTAPENPEIHYALGIAYSNLDQHDLAFEQFETIQPQSKFYSNAAVHMAIIYYQKKDIDKGIEVLQAAYNNIPDSSRIVIIPYLVSLYKEKGFMDEAISMVNQGLALDPENADLNFELGVIFDKLGNTDGAIEQMKKVISLNPDHTDALNYLGYTYADKGILLEEAEQLIRKALSQEPENGYIIDSLGWLYYRKGMYTEAAAYLERAVSLVPDDPIILEHLGDVYRQLNQRDKALEYYEKALQKKDKDLSDLNTKIESFKKESSHF
ncbi:MAG: tetratricopeptide repeat protein [Desulfobacterales bacterium]|jgi:tetratricopeptide (TPR) repeat protein|nr:tetratricopeptide repeat protein [Desulfobacterales bacterium]